MRSDINEIKKTFSHMMSQKQHSSAYKIDSPKAQDPSIAGLANNNATLLKGGHSKKIGGMWTFKHEINSTKLYELLVNTEPKGDADMNLKNFYKHIKMCINMVNRL